MARQEIVLSIVSGNVHFTESTLKSLEKCLQYAVTKHQDKYYKINEGRRVELTEVEKDVSVWLIDTRSDTLKAFNEAERRTGRGMSLETYSNR